MPTARGALAGAVVKGRLHVVGGAVKSFFRLVNTGAHEVYDPETDQWQTLAPLPTPRDHLAVVSHGNKLFAIGGRVNVDYNRNLSSNEVYDPSTGKWSTAAGLPTARSGITAQVLNGRIHVFGGESGEGFFRQRGV